MICFMMPPFRDTLLQTVSQIGMTEWERRRQGLFSDGLTAKALETVENKIPSAFLSKAMELQGTNYLLKTALSLHSLIRIPGEIFIKYV